MKNSCITQSTRGPRFATACITACMAALVLSGLYGCASDKESNMPGPSASKNAFQNSAIQNSLPKRDMPGQAVIDPAEVVRANVQLASNYFMYGQYDAALEAVHRALASQPDNAQALVLAGFSFLEIKDAARAEESFSRAMASAPNDPDVLHNYATFLCRTGREAQSIGVFDRAIRITTYRRPGLSQAGAGVCLANMNRQDEAAARFSEALTTEPMHPQALLGMAQFEFRKGDADRSLMLLKRHQQVSGASPEALWLEVQIARARGSRDDALMASSDLRSKFPESAQTKLLNNSIGSSNSGTGAITLTR